MVTVSVVTVSLAVSYTVSVVGTGPETGGLRILIPFGAAVVDIGPRNTRKMPLSLTTYA